mmetsp:Transcript_19010/g.76264  ORF Transcript_19010/g.76264 Transcript_19010/m.76264 type:complete len:204 (+) Transcript_19010:2777-3388(+)
MKIYGWKLRSVFIDDGRMSFELDYTAYLRAKVVIDDEALNKRVYDSFVSHLEALSASKSGPLRILEVAGGIGTMIVRICRDSPSLLGKEVFYDLVDVKKSNLRSAAEYLRSSIVKERETFSIIDRLDSVDKGKEQFGSSIDSHFASSCGDGHISCVLGDLRVNLICSDGLEYARKVCISRRTAERLARCSLRDMSFLALLCAW